MATCTHGNTYDVHCDLCVSGRPIPKTRARGQLINDLYAYANDADKLKVPLIGSTMREAAQLLELDQPKHPVSECRAECEPENLQDIRTCAPGTAVSHQRKAGESVLGIARISNSEAWAVWSRYKQRAETRRELECAGDDGCVFVWRVFAGPYSDEQCAFNALQVFRQVRS